MRVPLRVPLDDIVGPRAVGARIRMIREGNGLTQEAFAERIGAQRSQVKNWENGVGRPKPEEAFKISSEFGVDFNFIYTGDARQVAAYLLSVIGSSPK